MADGRTPTRRGYRGLSAVAPAIVTAWGNAKLFDAGLPSSRKAWTPRCGRCCWMTDATAAATCGSAGTAAPTAAAIRPAKGTPEIPDSVLHKSAGYAGGCSPRIRFHGDTGCGNPTPATLSSRLCRIGLVSCAEPRDRLPLGGVRS